ncbi:MAG: SurA N-terminal domain-containing protein [Gammaproteobacteria bacterium]|nr:SurA N-terminal domain-containing protein [Gammaproteobacteria bacterium]MCY4227253.1 SurA N-terminal domain-containing protein [Gammaproteobacteria bacterium]
MLTAIKQRATGWVAWAIVILITIPFALWGINSYFEGGTEVSVASVNGERLSLYAYQDSLQNRAQVLRQQLGDSFDPEMLESMQVRRSVLDSIINETIIDQYVVEQGFRISDEQLNRTIHNAEIFQADGQFDPVQYQSVLAANRYTPQLYEEVERMNQAASQVRLGIVNSAFALDTEVDQLLAIRQQQRDIQYALLKVRDLAEGIEINEDEVKDYYDNNSEDFVSPARMKVSFVELDVESLSILMEPDDQQIAGFYEDNKGRYQTAESRRARHILVAVNDSATDEERQEKLNLADELLERLESGEDFAELAGQYSDDPGSRSNGGDLGIIARGQMVAPFEDAVYGMSEGDIEGPVETQYGYHIINLVELTEVQQQTLEEAREGVVEELRDILAEQRFAELAEPFMNLVFEHPESLELVSDELGLTIEESDWFTEASGDGVTSEAKVRRAAFSEEVLNENLVSQPIEIGFDRIIAIQKLEHEPAMTQSLDGVRDEIVSILRDEHAKQEVLSLGKEYLQMLDKMDAASQSWIEFTEDKGLDISDLTFPSRAEVPGDRRALGEAVYASARPQEGEVLFGGAILSNGDYALYKLDSVTDGVIDEIDDSTRQAFSNRLVFGEGAGMMSGFSKQLRDQAEIEVFEDRL